MRRKPVPRLSALLVIAVLATMVVVADRISKDIAERTLAAGARPFIANMIEFRLTYNSGAAWGIMQGARVYFLIIAVVTIAVVLAYLMSVKQHPAMVVIGFGIFIGGSIGNAIDRLLAGRVVDFLNLLFMDFPVFNIADCAITIGAILVFLSIFISSRTSSVADEDLVADTEGAADGAGV
ncbi:MAG: signal peptidase II [Coriobacteriia bacterium]|nr:signal peptidase II [Coriobacteriia bacterium]